MAGRVDEWHIGAAQVFPSRAPSPRTICPPDDYMGGMGIRGQVVWGGGWVKEGGGAEHSIPSAWIPSKFLTATLFHALSSKVSFFNVGVRACVHACMHVCGWMDGWMDGRTDGRIEGWIYVWGGG